MLRKMNVDDPHEREKNKIFYDCFISLCCLFKKLILTSAGYYYFIKLY